MFPDVSVMAAWPAHCFDPDELTSRVPCRAKLNWLQFSDLRSMRKKDVPSEYVTRSSHHGMTDKFQMFTEEIYGWFSTVARQGRRG